MSNNSDNITQLPTNRVNKKEAAQWLVRIDQGSLNKKETEAFHNWIKESDFNLPYLEKLARNWDDMAVLENLAELFPIDQHNHYSQFTGRFIKNYPALIKHAITPATIIITLSFFSLISFLTLYWQWPTVYTTSIGQQATHQLEDGSSVTLNTNSKIRVDYSGGVRKVHLLRGEANFIVAKKPDRPFIVHAGDGLVWAVGTEFNVRYRSNQSIDVTVSEGTIKVFTEVDKDRSIPSIIQKAQDLEATKTEAIIHAGQIIQYDKSIKSQKKVSQNKLSQTLAWKQGIIIFHGESLEQAISEINRYTDIQLIITDPSIQNMRIGGHFKIDDLDALLTTLGKGFNLNINKVSNQVIQFSGKS